MAWLVGDGFDFYANASDATANPAVWQSVSQSVMEPTGSRFGLGNWLLLGNTSAIVGNYYTIQFADSSVIYVNMNIRSAQAHVNGGTVQCVGFNWRDGSSGGLGSLQGGFYLRNGGDFVVTSNGINGTVLGSPSSVLCPSANVWHHIQVKIVVHNTTGSVELRIDGATSASYLVTGINTRNGTANAFSNIIHLNASSVDKDGVDDFYVFNDQGAQPNTWQGDVWCVQQVPAADIAPLGWTRNTGANNCLTVDDGPEDGDATYVATNTVNAVDTYGISQLITTPANIVAVTLRYLSRMDDAGPHAVTAQLHSGPTTITLPNYTTTNTYTYQQAVYVTDPNTSAIWSADAVNALLLSVKDIL